MGGVNGTWVECRDCRGAGRYEDEDGLDTCDTCDGAGGWYETPRPRPANDHRVTAAIGEDLA